jgi:hypothetical protein
LRSSVIIGFLGGILAGVLLFFSLKLALAGGPGGALEILLYFSPQIVYFMCVYMSIKIFTRNQPNPVPDFKGCLKAGGITSLIISLIMGIGYFIGLTHIDIDQHVKEMIAAGQGDKVKAALAGFTKQMMMDRTQRWIMPNFLLGFAISVLVTVIFRLRGKKVA